MELEICTKTLQNFSTKLRAKFSFPPFACLWYVVLASFTLSRKFFAPNRRKAKNCSKKKRGKKKVKRKNKQIKTVKSKVVGWFIVSQNFDLCTCTCKKVVEHDFCEKQERIFHSKGRLSDLGQFQHITDLGTSKKSEKFVFPWKNSGYKRVKQRIIVKESLILPYSQIAPVLLLGKKLTKYCILYNALFTKSYHTISKLSHSYTQFPSSTLETSSAMKPLLASKMACMLGLRLSYVQMGLSRCTLGMIDEFRTLFKTIFWTVSIKVFAFTISLW